MPRQRTNHSRTTSQFPGEFGLRLERFKEASGLSWAEIARCLGTYPFTVRRWRTGGRPNPRHLLGLLKLDNPLGLRESLVAGREEELIRRIQPEPSPARNAQLCASLHSVKRAERNYVTKSLWHEHDSGNKAGNQMGSRAKELLAKWIAMVTALRRCRLAPAGVKEPLNMGRPRAPGRGRHRV